MIMHRPGTASGKPNTLSHQANHDKGEDNNQGVILLNPVALISRASHTQLLPGKVEDWLQTARDWDGEEEEDLALARKKLAGGAGQALGGHLDLTGELITYNGCIYLPPDRQLCYTVTHAIHNVPAARHPGQAKTMDLLSREYWWPRMACYMADCIQTCDTCNWAKTFLRKPAGLLHLNEVPEQCWGIVTQDLVTFLTKSHGYNAVWVAVDRMSKRV